MEMKSNKRKIGIVWANPYNLNLGVGALAYSSLSLLNDVCRDNNIDAEFYFFGSSRDDSDSVEIGDSLIHFHNIKGFDFYNWKVIIKRIFFPRKLQLSSLKSFDIVFDIAEGDSFTDIYGEARFWKILNSKRYFNRLGKRQVLLPQTIGPFNDRKHESEAFKVMKSLTRVISRDNKSFEYTKKFLGLDKINETIDVAFYMPFRKTMHGGTDGSIHVGVNVSGLLWNGGYTRNNQFGMKSDYRKIIEDTVQYFTSMENVTLHIVSHVIPLDRAVEDDYAVAKQIQTRYPQVVVSPRFSDPIEAKSYISGLDFFTGARMHACIAAFSSGVPVYPMAYSRKFNGLFEDTLQYKWMGDCVNCDTETVVDGVKKAFENRQILKQEIDSAEQKIIAPRIVRLKGILSNVLLEA